MSGYEQRAIEAHQETHTIGDHTVPYAGGICAAPSGTRVDLYKPTTGMIHLEDLANHLANQPRFGGAMWFPIAQHSVNVSRALEYLGADRELQLVGLHHDDEEAFFHDYPRPHKRTLSKDYIALMDNMKAVIFAALGLRIVLLNDPRISAVDHVMFVWEKLNHMPDAPWWTHPDIEWGFWESRLDALTGTPMEAWTPARAKQEYLARHIELADL